MTIPQAEEVFNYWREDPPEHELLAAIAIRFESWQPGEKQYANEEERTAAHRESLERRWASGQYMNAKQIFDSMGGKVMVKTAEEMKKNPNAITPDRFPGIGPFPGSF